MTVLVLGGTTEGRALAALLAAAGVDVLTSLAGAVRAPLLPVGRVRIGGFGGAEGFRAVLAREEVTAIVDSTHPFAARISARTQSIAADLGVPCLRVARPAWTRGPGDDWTDIDTLAAAGALVAPGARVFLATGRQSLPEATALAHATLLLRVIDPAEADFPYPPGRFVVGRPPFTEPSERALFAAERIDVLVAKNSGGAAGLPKLEAARALGVRVLMVRRPAPPPGESVATAAAAADWVLRLRRVRHG